MKKSLYQFNIGDIVYLVTDLNDIPSIVVAVVDYGSHFMYCIKTGIEVDECFDFELSSLPSNLMGSN